MSFVVMEYSEGIGSPVSETFKNKQEAEEERIYLQPDFENKLKVIYIKD